MLRAFEDWKLSKSMFFGVATGGHYSSPMCNAPEATSSWVSDASGESAVSSPPRSAEGHHSLTTLLGCVPECWQTWWLDGNRAMTWNKTEKLRSLKGHAIYWTWHPVTICSDELWCFTAIHGGVYYHASDSWLLLILRWLMHKPP